LVVVDHLVVVLVVQQQPHLLQMEHIQCLAQLQHTVAVQAALDKLKLEHQVVLDVVVHLAAAAAVRMLVLVQADEAALVFTDKVTAD
jgi:hypothetical protein